MPTYLLQHRHRPEECGATYASFRGHDSPLRRRSAMSSCRSGEHEIWWRVLADDASSALGMLPAFTAERTDVRLVTEVEIP